MAQKVQGLDLNFNVFQGLLKAVKAFTELHQPKAFSGTLIVEKAKGLNHGCKDLKELPETTTNPEEHPKSSELSVPAVNEASEDLNYGLEISMVPKESQAVSIQKSFNLRIYR
jgi:hypothetical protein